MGSNEANIKDKLYENYEDSLWKVLMYEYAEVEGKKFVEENETLKKEDKYKPSPEAVKKFNKKMNAAFRKPKYRNLMKSIWPVVNKAAVFIVMIGVIFSISFTFVSGFRIQVLNLILSLEEKYTLIKLDDNGNENIIADNLYVNWHNAYVPTYIPQGYNIYNLTNTLDFKTIDYINNEDDVINFCELNASMENTLDTENASLIKNVDINGNEGLLVVKDDKVSIAWSDNIKIFVIHTQLSIEETEKIAESVTYIK